VNRDILIVAHGLSARIRTMVLSRIIAACAALSHQRISVFSIIFVLFLKLCFAKIEQPISYMVEGVPKTRPKTPTTSLVTVGGIG
jgi:hypothetical protein